MITEKELGEDWDNARAEATSFAGTWSELNRHSKAALKKFANRVLDRAKYADKKRVADLDSKILRTREKLKYLIQKESENRQTAIRHRNLAGEELSSYARLQLSEVLRVLNGSEDG